MIKVKDFNVGDKVYILRNQNLREGIVTNVEGYTLLLMIMIALSVSMVMNLLW